MNFDPLAQIPPQAWQRPIGLGWEKPYTVRYASNLDDGPWHGMPLGGFGAGCIGRSSRGDFNLWHLDGGEHIFQTIPGCQFSVFEQVGELSQAYSLCTEPPSDGSLGAWQWYPQYQGTYGALYPRSWFQYQGVFQAALTCEQFSPIIPHNYQETSYPVGVFVWTAHNPTDQPITLSFMLSWQNMVGWFSNATPASEIRIRDDGSPVYDYTPRLGQSKGNYNSFKQSSTQASCLLQRDRDPNSAIKEGEGEWAISVPLQDGLEIFYHSRWNPIGDGVDLWDAFSQDGSLSNIQNNQPATDSEQIGAALAVRFTLAPGESKEIPFVLAWDLPVTEFAPDVNYFRRYTDFWDQSGTNAEKIAQTALENYQQWQEQIQAWQQPILEHPDWPDDFKMALINELYDLTSGGSLWTAATKLEPLGQYAVLECLDYRWYESLDVRLYGSFALLYLWPELEKGVMRAFARAIPTEDPKLRIIGYYYQGDPVTAHKAPRKIAQATPHDLGAPNEHPWQASNYTSYQDCNLWKDLASDFVLLVYRDYLLTGAKDLEFLISCWPSVVSSLDYLKTFDTDGNGLPENSGAPDQTYDDWQLKGVSAYCGGLWIAALEAALAIAKLVESQGINTKQEQEKWLAWLTQSRPTYQAKLWNGQFYRLDSDSNSQVVMADQLCGQYYARLLNLPDVVPIDCAESALKTVYDVCFLNFHNGQLGAANGLLPDGSPEKPNATHPLEVWIGINYGLAAFLYQMGMQDRAWKLTQTVIQQIYDNGLQFRTPEAITAVGTFRACMYLRPMAIWAMYGQITNA